MAPVPKAVSEALLSPWGAAAAKGRSPDEPRGDERGAARAVLAGVLVNAANAVADVSSPSEGASWSNIVRSSYAPLPFPPRASRLESALAEVSQKARGRNLSRAFKLSSEAHLALPLECGWLPVKREIPEGLPCDPKLPSGLRVNAGTRMFQAGDVCSEALGTPPERVPVPTPAVDDPRSPHISSGRRTAGARGSSGILPRMTPVSTSRRGRDGAIGNKYTNKRLARSAGNPGALVELGASSSALRSRGIYPSGSTGGNRNGRGHTSVEPPILSESQKKAKAVLDRAKAALERAKSRAPPVPRVAKRRNIGMTMSMTDNATTGDGEPESDEPDAQVADEMVRRSHAGYASQKRREAREAQKKQILLEKQMRKERLREKNAQQGDDDSDKRRGSADGTADHSEARPTKRIRSGSSANEDEDVQEVLEAEGDVPGESDRDQGEGAGEDRRMRTRGTPRPNRSSSNFSDGPEPDGATEDESRSRSLRSLRSRSKRVEAPEHDEDAAEDDESEDDSDGEAVRVYRREVPRTSILRRESGAAMNPARPNVSRRYSESESYIRMRSPSHHQGLAPKEHADRRPNRTPPERFQGPMRPHETAFQAIAEHRAVHSNDTHGHNLNLPGAMVPGMPQMTPNVYQGSGLRQPISVSGAPITPTSGMEYTKRLLKARDEVRRILATGGNDLIKENSPEFDQIVTFFMGQGHTEHWATVGPGLRFPLANPIWDQSRKAFVAQRMLLLYYPNMNAPSASWQVEDVIF